MSISKELFALTPDKEEVFLYTLNNEKGLRAELLSYGGIVRSLFVKGKNGEYTDVVLGRETIDEYLHNDGYFGAIVGRFANRIYRGSFSIDGKAYSLAINNKGNSLHGGIKGFDKYIWDEYKLCKEPNPSITLHHISPDGDEGYPGKLDVYVTYCLNEKNGLEIHYEATSDKDTVINLTNHSYFNLNGAGEGDVLGHTLQMNCSFYTPNSSEGIPYGEILSVESSPFDFRQPKTIGKDICADNPQIRMFGGYDHNFVIDGTGLRKTATVCADKTGISMEVYTNKPGVQLYTANGLDSGRICKMGKTYQKHGAFCLETQFFPNSTSFSHFGSPLLRKGEKYSYTTEYRFVL